MILFVSTFKLVLIMCLTLGVWVVVKKMKSGRTENIWQGKTQAGVRKAMHKHIKEAGEKPIGAWPENDEFGKGDSIRTTNKYDDETFYTSGEV